MIVKPRIIIYEGIPGSGKSTLRQAYGRKTLFEDLSIDRFTPTQWCFSRLRDEEIEDNQSEIEKALNENFNIYIIWCKCSIEMAYERCKDKEDDKDCSLEDLKKLELLYKKYFQVVNKFSKVLVIDTEKYTTNECISQMSNWINYENK